MGNVTRKHPKLYRLGNKLGNAILQTIFNDWVWKAGTLTWKKARSKQMSTTCALQMTRTLNRPTQFD